MSLSMRPILMLLLALGLASPAAVSAALQKGIIEVGKTQGVPVAKDASGRKANLTQGQTFKEGTRIETQANSTVQLIFSNGATILVTPETQIAIKIFTQVASPLIVAGKYLELQAEPSPSIVQIELFRGKIIGEARKLNPSTQFTVKTPVGLTRVRGTVWSDEYIFDEQKQSGQQTTTCVKGQVEVNDLKGSLPIPIIKGQEVVISAPAPKPPTLFLDEDTPLSGDMPPSLPRDPVITPRVADPEKIKEIVNDFKENLQTPPPGTQPPDDEDGGQPGDDKPPQPPTVPTVPKPTPNPVPNPPGDAINDVIKEIIEKENQDNLSPSGG
jgi:hypothetical protein